MKPACFLLSQAMIWKSFCTLVGVHTKTNAHSHKEDFYDPACASLVHKQSATTHTKLPPTMTSIKLLKLKDKRGFRWPAWANEWTATESRGHLAQQGTAGHSAAPGSDWGRSDRQQDSHCHLWLIAGSHLTRRSMLVSDTTAKRSHKHTEIHTLTQTDSHTAYWMSHLMFARRGVLLFRYHKTFH